MSRVEDSSVLAAIQFPSWISPEIIPGLPLRWYGLMYVVGFAITWLLFNREAKRREAPWSEDEAASFFFWAIVGLLVGARIFGTFLYDPQGYYLSHPWLAFWPFDETGRFVGFQGMSYHGGLLGIFIGTLIYAWIKKLPWLAIGDVIAVSAPLGYTFGRLGNFINGELWGKVCTSPIGMIFPGASRFPSSEEWVRRAATEAGIPLDSAAGMVNLPRYPSQLFEAAFEGLVLWLVLWFLVRKRRAFPGFAIGAYLAGYGVARFIIEYFREPDQGMGWIIPLGDPGAPTWLFTTPLNFSMGQVLSSFMILGGIVWMAFGGRLVARFAPPQAIPSAKPKSSARKTRKKVK